MSTNSVLMSASFCPEFVNRSVPRDCKHDSCEEQQLVFDVMQSRKIVSYFLI